MAKRPKQEHLSRRMLLEQKLGELVQTVQELAAAKQLKPGKVEELRGEFLELTYYELMRNIGTASRIFAKLLSGDGPHAHGYDTDIDAESFANELIFYVLKKYEGQNFVRFICKYSRREDGSFLAFFGKVIRNASIEYFRKPITAGKRSTGASKGQELKRVRRSSLENSTGRERPEVATGLASPRKKNVRRGDARTSLAPAVRNQHNVAWDASESAAELEARISWALAKLSMGNRAAIHLHFCAILPVPEEIVSYLAERHGVPPSAICKRIDEMRKPLLNKLEAAVDADKEEVLLTQRVIVENSDACMEEVRQVAGHCGISHAELASWEEEALEKTYKDLKRLAREEKTAKRRQLRWTFQHSRRRMRQAKNKAERLEKERKTLPHPRRQDVGELLGIGEPGAIARINRGCKRLKALLKWSEKNEMRAS